MTKVNAIETSIVGLNNKLDAKVASLDYNLDDVLLSLFEATKSGLTVAEWEAHLTNLSHSGSSISLRKLKRSTKRVWITNLTPSQQY